MEHELIINQLKLINELHNDEATENILNWMQPLVKKYIKKLYFMEKEDAYQELNLTLIEAIQQIKSYKNEAMCLAYFNKAIINKYNYLCKKNIRENQHIDKFCDLSENQLTADNNNVIELFVFFSEICKGLNRKQKQIVRYFIKGFSDTEISEKMHISRQYVNKFRRQFKIKVEIAMK